MVMFHHAGIIQTTLSEISWSKALRKCGIIKHIVNSDVHSKKMEEYFPYVLDVVD